MCDFGLHKVDWIVNDGLYTWRNITAAHFLFVSTGFIGHLPNIKEMLADWTGEDTDSDQLFFTNIYIDPVKRVSLFYYLYYISPG